MITITTTAVTIYFSVLSFLMMVYMTAMFYTIHRLVQDNRSLKKGLEKYIEYYELGTNNNDVFLHKELKETEPVELPKKKKVAKKATEKKAKTTKKTK